MEIFIKEPNIYYSYTPGMFYGGSRVCHTKLFWARSLLYLVFFLRPGLSARRGYLQVGSAIQVLAAAMYRLAIHRFSPRQCTDWLYTGSRPWIVQIGFRQVLAVAIYRLALYSFAPWLYTDWLCTGSRRGYIQIGYIQVLAVAVYKLAIYIYRCYIQTGPNISLHRSIRSNPARRVPSSARWLIATHLMVECTNCIEEQVGESSLKALAFSRQENVVDLVLCVPGAPGTLRFGNVAIPARRSRMPDKGKPQPQGGSLIEQQERYAIQGP